MMNSTKSVKLLFMLSLTTGMFLTELIIGRISNSITLIADSFHMLSDLLSLIIATYAVRLAGRKQWSSNFTYGWQRAEVLGALVNGVFLLALCFSVFIDSVERMVGVATSESSGSEGHHVGLKDPLLVLWVGIAGLVVNLMGLLVFHEHGHHHGHDHGHNSSASLKHSHNHDENGHSHGKGSLNMRGVFLHVLGDALGSVGVIISALIVYFAPNWPFSPYIDPLMSLIIIAIILFTTIPLVKTTARIVLQGVPDSVDIEQLCREILAVYRVIDVHELHIWQLSDTKLVASIHVVIDCCCSRPSTGDKQDATNITNGGENDHSVFMDVAVKIKQIFHAHQIHSVTIQPEYHVPKAEVETQGKEVSGAITFHNGDKVITIEDDKEIACLLRCSASGVINNAGQAVNECTVEDECCPDGVVREWKYARNQHETTSIVRSKTPSIPLEDLHHTNNGQN